MTLLVVGIPSDSRSTPGDPTGDGFFGTNDIICVARGVVGLDVSGTPCANDLAAMDVNCSGEVLSNDIIFIAKLVVGLPMGVGQDDDNDNIHNACDNCPTVANFEQADGDEDGEGDACASECIDGEEQEGTTVCGLNAEGVLMQDCTDGVWVETTTCTGTDVCPNGDSGMGGTTCGLNNEGVYMVDCTDGVWVNNDICTGTDMCINGGSGMGATPCGLNNEGVLKQDCTGGQWVDNNTCTGTDECTDGGDDCGANATCINSSGSFTCTCNPGYTGDGVSCTDIDECATNNGGCDANATCTNSESASPSCACNAGFAGNGTSCSAILCGTNEHVVSNSCVPCSTGTTNAAGDVAANWDTICDTPASVGNPGAGVKSLTYPWNNWNKYIVYSPEDVHNKYEFYPFGVPYDAADHFVIAEFFGGPPHWWQCLAIDHPTNQWRPCNFPPNAVAVARFYGGPVSDVQDLMGVNEIDNGLQIGYASGDLTFQPNVYNGVTSPGDVTVGGTQFVRWASCGDDVCDGNIGETCSSCAPDCGFCTGTSCAESASAINVAPLSTYTFNSPNYENFGAPSLVAGNLTDGCYDWSSACAAHFQAHTPAVGSASYATWVRFDFDTPQPIDTVKTWTGTTGLESYRQSALRVEAKTQKGWKTVHDIIDEYTADTELCDVDGNGYTVAFECETATAVRLSWKWHKPCCTSQKITRVREVEIFTKGAN